MTAAIIVLSIGIVSALGGVLLFGAWSRDATRQLATVTQERNAAELARKQTENDMKVAADELAREKARHVEDVEEAAKEIAHARKLLRRAGATDPDITDERLRWLFEKLSARSAAGRGDPGGLPGREPTHPVD